MQPSQTQMKKYITNISTVSTYYTHNTVNQRN